MLYLCVKDKRIREMRNGMNTIEKNINVIEISDISAPELDVFARMTETQLRSKLEPGEGHIHCGKPDCYQNRA